MSYSSFSQNMGSPAANLGAGAGKASAAMT